MLLGVHRRVPSPGSQDVLIVSDGSYTGVTALPWVWPGGLGNTRTGNGTGRGLKAVCFAESPHLPGK